MSEQPTGPASDLVVPVYIDANLLLDLLASREGGFSLVEQVTSRTAGSKEAETSISGGFGVSGVLNLLKIDIGGSRRGASSTEQGSEVTAERFHTYGSLLHRLRLNLEREGAVRHFGATQDEWSQIAPGDFVEVVGVFRPNPFADALTTIMRLLEIAELAEQLDDKSQSGGQKSQGGSQRKGTRRQEPSELEQMRRFLERLLGDAERQDVALFLIEPDISEAHTVVVFVFPEYLRDKTFTELLQGEFRVLGKAVRKIDTNAEEEIELLRGTALGSLNEEMLGPLVQALSQLGSEGIRLPEIVTEVSPPALQLIPIAIYV